MDTELNRFSFIALMFILLCADKLTLECNFERCHQSYRMMLSVLEGPQKNEYGELCPTAFDLRDCFESQSEACRGDLHFHALQKIVRDKMKSFSMTENCHRDLVGSPSTRMKRPKTKIPNECSPHTPEDDYPSVGCAVYGLTNLKSFSDPFNFSSIHYCSLSGAWNVIVTPEFVVQITNKGGLSPLPEDVTATTLVTVLIKKSKCSEQKLYQATFDEVPSMFTDGQIVAGSVHLETIEPSVHVRIQFPFLQTRIDIIKVQDRLPIPFLTIAIKMAKSKVDKMLDSSTGMRGIPLCFYGCPKTATMQPKTRQPGPYDINNKQQCYVPVQGKSGSVGTKRGNSIELEADWGKSVGPHDFNNDYGTDDYAYDIDDEEYDNKELGHNKRRYLRQNSEKNSHSSDGAAVICSSLNTVYELLHGSILMNKLPFPGEESFGFSSYHPRSDGNSGQAESAALTSQAPTSGFHNYFVLMSVLVILWYETQHYRPVQLN